MDNCIRFIFSDNLACQQKGMHFTGIIENKLLHDFVGFPLFEAPESLNKIFEPFKSHLITVADAKKLRDYLDAFLREIEINT